MPGPIAAEPFSEKGFYLAEFRGRTLAVAARGALLRDAAPLEALLKELEGNGTRVLLLSTAREPIERLTQGEAISAARPRLEGEVWRRLGRVPRAAIWSEEEASFPRRVRETALRLGLTKLMWVDPAGGLSKADGARASFVHLDELVRLLRQGPPGEGPERRELLGEIEACLRLGVAAVNLCTLVGLADELFTYTGSGTLFTRERYVAVRRLGLDDYDAADHLLARGVSEGYLAPRSAEEVDRVLASGFGAFVEGRHLAGIGALLEHRDDDAAEIASLYTLTRFLGEGVGSHLIRHALERARDLGFGWVFACTTSDPVSRFFERHGFQRVGPERIPAEKWRGYDPERRTRIVCLRIDLR